MTDKCKQNIRGRRCTITATQDGYCHAHIDQSLYARVGIRCGVSKGQVEQVAQTLIDEMSWDEIYGFTEESRKGQSIREDAGGYLLRCIGRLFGVKPECDEVTTYKKAAAAMLAQATQQPSRDTLK